MSIRPTGYKKLIIDNGEGCIPSHKSTEMRLLKFFKHERKYHMNEMRKFTMGLSLFDPQDAPAGDAVHKQFYKEVLLLDGDRNDVMRYKVTTDTDNIKRLFKMAIEAKEVGSLKLSITKHDGHVPLSQPEPPAPEDGRIVWQFFKAGGFETQIFKSTGKPEHGASILIRTKPENKLVYQLLKKRLPDYFPNVAAKIRDELREEYEFWVIGFDWDKCSRLVDILCDEPAVAAFLLSVNTVHRIGKKQTFLTEAEAIQDGLNFMAKVNKEKIL
jgi:hypothetical protein